MSVLTNMAIRHKLILIIMLTCIFALLLTGGTFILWEWARLRETMVRNLSTQAEMIADNCKAALSFEDVKDAEGALQVLRIQSSIVYAGIYNSSGEELAEYYRYDIRKNVSSSELQKDGHIFSNGYLSVARSVVLDGETIGKVCLQSDLHPMHKMLRRSIEIIVIALLFVSLVVYFVSLRLQRVISGPVLSLAESAAKIGKGELNHRVEIRSKDELGHLAASFNEMAGKLKESYTTLEEKVQERTEELSSTNRKLEKQIAERKEAEEETLRQKENLDAVFNAAPTGMLLLDENMVVKKGNDAVAKLVGKKTAEIINNQFGNGAGCIHSYDDNKGCGHGPFCPQCPIRNTVEKVLSSGEAVSGTEVYTTFSVDGNEVSHWLEVSVKPVNLDGNKHVVLAVNNITERKEAEEKIKETVKLKSQFVSTVSHELRTPLTAIKNAISLILDGATGEFNEKQGKFLDVAKRNIDRLAALVNDVLDFQKLTTYKIELNIEENDIKASVESVHETMLLFAKEKEINLSVEFEDNLPKAKFDGDKIIQVLTNFVSNSIKFTPEGGKVSIGVKHQSEELAISVSDTGMGIPKEALPKIFGQFYRVERPGQQIKGTGLGLAIVEKIVELHGGRIEVESEPGQGTTFTVFLPLEAKALPEVSPEETDEVVEKTFANS